VIHSRAIKIVWFQRGRSGIHKQSLDLNGAKTRGEVEPLFAAENVRIVNASAATFTNRHPIPFSEPSPVSAVAAKGCHALHGSARARRLRADK
jgi:hypothetical protein